MLKQNADSFGSYICQFFNVCFDKGTFPSVLKCATTTLAFKKGCRGSKENYRPVNILPVISKFSKKCYATKQRLSWISFCLSANVAFESESMLSIAFLPCLGCRRKQLTPEKFLVLF